MPSNTFMTESPSPTRAGHPTTLDEAVTLINKKKIGKDDIDEQKLLHRAADSGHVKLAKKCISAGCNTLKRLTSLNGTSALHCAARADKNSAQITKLLLESGIDVDIKNDLGETAIFSAIIHRNMETVDLLVDHGSNINSVWQDSTPIYLTLYNRDLESAIKMLKHGAEITNLQEPTRQPLHAVLDLCHSNQLISYQTMQMLKLIIQSDGNVISHLQSWTPRIPHPGCTSQELIFHIYRMEKGPVQSDGKSLVRHLIHLGYVPSRGELSTMSQSDQDYDEVYSYIKCGPASLKDLCVRKIRRCIPINVTHGMEKWKGLPDKERTQIMLEPLPLPDHEYENVTVLKRHKDARKSKRKSLKDVLTGISRLSRRFSKKNPAAGKTEESSNTLSLSLPQHRLSSRMSGSLPAGVPAVGIYSAGTDTEEETTSGQLVEPEPSPQHEPQQNQQHEPTQSPCLEPFVETNPKEQKPEEPAIVGAPELQENSKPVIKPKPNLRPKPKFVKRDQRASAAAVADVVKRYSNDCAEEEESIPNGYLPPDPDPVTSEAITSTASSDQATTSPLAASRVSASIKIDNVAEEYPTAAHSPQESQHVDDVIVKFRDSAYSSGRSDNLSGAQLTPMRDHAPELGSSYSLPMNSGSIHIESEDAML